MSTIIRQPFDTSASEISDLVLNYTWNTKMLDEEKDSSSTTIELVTTIKQNAIMTLSTWTFASTNDCDIQRHL